MANCKFDNINDPLLRDFIKYYGQKSGMELFLKQVQKVENALYVNPNAVYSDTQRRNLLKKQRKFNLATNGNHLYTFTPVGTGYKVNLKIGFMRSGYYDKSYSGHESKVGKFVDGEFIPPDDSIAATKNKKSNKFQPLLNDKESEIREKRKNITSIRIKIKNSKSPSQKNILTKQLDRLKEDELKLINDAEKLTKLSAIEDIFKFADKDLELFEKLFTNDTVSRNDIQLIDKKINLWLKISDTSTDEHPILDKDEIETSNITEKLAIIRSKVEVYSRKLNNIKKEQLLKDIKENLSDDLTEEDVLKSISDRGWITTHVRDISQLNIPVLQHIAKLVKNANSRAFDEAKDRLNEIDKVSKKVLPKLKRLTKGNPFSYFKQVYENGKETGNVVFRFTQEFYDKRNNLRWNAFGKKNRTKKDIDAWFNFKKENMILFDARLLFEDSLPEDSIVPESYIYSRIKKSEKQKEEHANELLEILGEKGFNIYMESINEKIDTFKLDREAAYSRIFNSEEAIEIKEELFEDWLKENSPYVYADMQENDSQRYKIVKENGKDVRKYYNTKGYTYTSEIPRRITTNGEKTKWYDEKFAKIEADPDLYEFYNLMFDTLNEMKSILPHHKVNHMSVNSIPHIRASLIDIFSEKGMAIGVKPLWDTFMEATRSDNISNISYEEEDAFGNIEKNIQTRFLIDNSGKIDDLYKLKIIKYKQETGKKPDFKTSRELKKDAIDEIAREKSFDLPKILKAYSMMALSYKHKSVIEDQVKLAEQMFHKIKQKRETISGEQYKDPEEKGGNLKEDENELKNLSEMMTSFLDKVYYGIPTRKLELTGKKKKYTLKEKERKEELDDLLKINEENLKNEEIKEQEYQKNKDLIEKELKELGGVYVGSKWGDVLLKYVQLKGMGWNVFSGFANMGFGAISNWVEAGGRRLYNNKQLFKAYNLVLHSMGSNLTLDLAKSKTAKKIRVLMDNYDVLKDASNELYKSGVESSFTKQVKRFGPYNIQKRSEYINQAPIMIAMMMGTKIKDKNGNESNLWEAYNEEGVLKEEFKTEKNISQWEGDLSKKEDNKEKNDFKNKLDQVIVKNHGNYDPDKHLAIKDIWLGRAASQFRTWMFEGFASRFEQEKMDYALNLKVKGRYRSYGVFMGSENEKTGEIYSPIENIFFTLKQLSRKMIGLDTKFDERFDEVDAANMRKNLSELVIYMSLYSVGLLLKYAGDEDDDEKPNLVLNFLINQGNRLQTDILFYTNPMEFERLTKSTLPVMDVVTDSFLWLDAVARQLDPEKRNVKSGTFKGMNWLLRESLEMTPGTAQALRLWKNMQTVMKK